MQKEQTSLKIYSWLAWSLFVGHVIVIVMVVHVLNAAGGFTLVEYVSATLTEDVQGHGLSYFQWMAFFFITLLALYRIGRGEIKHDGRGWLLCLLGILLFGCAVRLGDVPRVAMLAMPFMLFGVTRLTFGPGGKAMFIPCLLLLLLIPRMQFTGLETFFFESVKAVLFWVWNDSALNTSYFFLCDDVHYGSILSDALTGLFGLCFLTRKGAKNVAMIAVLSLLWSYVAAVLIYAMEYRFYFQIPDAPVTPQWLELASKVDDMPLRMLARIVAWLPIMIILGYDLLRSKKVSQLDQNQGSGKVAIV